MNIIKENIEIQTLSEPEIILDEYINLKINNLLDNQYTIEKYKPENLPITYLEKLSFVANDWFWIQMGKTDIKNHLFKSDEIFLLKINWKVVWFSSLVYLNDFIYRFWTVIIKKYQWIWLYKKLTKTILENNHKYFLRTQNKM